MIDDELPPDEAPEDRVAKVVELKAKRRVNLMTRLNARHAAIRMGASTVILDEQPGEPPIFMPIDAFHLWYANDCVKVNDEWMPVSRIWIKNPGRRQYERVVFDPVDRRVDHYNLWRGFAVQPDASKSCEKFLAHIRDNICAGNEAHYQYVLGYLAHMIQKPEEKPGVTLVLRGGEGSGKGFFTNVIGRLFPQHYIAISQREHLVGRFNAHFMHCLMAFVDEAMWAGDKQGEGTLKHLVTDHELMVEQKYKDGFMVRNILRLIIASNESWTVPAGMRARRWCVLDVANTRMQDRDYFRVIALEMMNGGDAALMHLLLNFDLNSVDVYNPPKTAALLEQKEETMHAHERWWMECLQQGELRYPGSSVPGDKYVEVTEGWPVEMTKESVWDSYRLWVSEHNLRIRLWPTTQLHKWLRPLLPGSEEYRPRHGAPDRKRRVPLPGLEACREAFEQAVGQTIEWETPEKADEDPFVAFGRDVRQAQAEG